MGYKNNFLVSLPSITGSSFNGSVVLIENHDGNGAKGWIINKEIEESVASTLRAGMNLHFKTPVYYGGPVDINNAWIIHTNDFKIQPTVKLNDDLSMTRDKTIVNILNSGNFPEYWRIIVGHARWGPGQLESEIFGSINNGKSHWTTIPYNHELMWDTPPKDQWNYGIKLSAEKLTSSVLNF
jgi:putative transcriptional regulator